MFFLGTLRALAGVQKALADLRDSLRQAIADVRQDQHLRADLANEREVRSRQAMELARQRQRIAELEAERQREQEHVELPVELL